jgi:hypothetical protein
LTETRRTFFLQAVGTAAALSSEVAETPWYRRTLRWGQTNITERDPERYDIPWWRAYWKRTEIQGVILNAGGIVAYYPSKFPLHHRAAFLGDRDLYGDLAKVAREDGLTVLARMDSSRAGEPFFEAHPDWFTRDASGAPYRAGDKYISCVNSPYYDEYLPGVLVEIIERTHPEGFTDNSWSGLGRDRICYCANCARKFRDKTGAALPARHDWSDAAYRRWIDWSYARRLEIWDLNNRTTRAAGGPHCLWVGMNSGSVSEQSESFRDYKAICERAEIILLDHQARSDSSGFEENADCGKRIHGLLGQDKLMPESMAMYQAGRTPFRLAAKPEPEARLWMLEGFAGGIQPWWHHVGAYHEDRRMFRTAEPIFRWHHANEAWLVNRRPLASVGVVWSQRNTDYYGRDDAERLVDLPYRGITQALVRARIPYIPVHADHIERDQAGLAVLFLPDLACMSDAQCEAVRRFVKRGGGVIASGFSSLFDESGDTRGDFGLADVFGAHAPSGDARAAALGRSSHTYLRIAPELQSHAVLRGFEETAILPFGGSLRALGTEPGVAIPLTFIPAFPVYPPETSWMRETKTDIPGLVLNGRAAYLAADIDRRYAEDNLPDHANLLANLVRWAAGDRIPLRVEGPGLLDCNLYAQPGRVILHVVNLTNEGAWRAPLDELIPVGPLAIRVRLPGGVAGRHLRLLAAGTEGRLSVKDGWAAFEIPSVKDHEVAVIG